MGWALLAIIPLLMTCKRERLIPSPVVQNLEVSREGSDILAHGYILDPGAEVQDHGFCWAEHPVPTIQDRHQSLGTSDNTGEFSCRMSGFEVATKYYFRPYLQSGGAHFYGEETEFHFSQWELIGYFESPTTDFPQLTFSDGNYGYVVAAKDWNTSALWRFDPLDNTFSEIGEWYYGKQGIYPFSVQVGASIYALAVHRDHPEVPTWLEYSPNSNSFIEQIFISLPDAQNHFGFSAGGKGYLGILNGHESKFFQFNSWNQWEQISLPEELKGKGGFGLTIGDRGFLCLPNISHPQDSSITITSKEIWEFIPSGKSWVQRPNFPGDPDGAIAYAQEDRFFMGQCPGQGKLWEYSSENVWREVSDTIPPGHVGIPTGKTFSIGDANYLIKDSIAVMAYNPDAYNGSMFREVWKFTPE